jgi:hypothetical protein
VGLSTWATTAAYDDVRVTAEDGTSLLTDDFSGDASKWTPRAYAYDTLGWTTVASLIVPTNTRSAALARRMGAVIDGQHQHPFYGPLDIWRHLSPADVRARA